MEEQHLNKKERRQLKKDKQRQEYQLSLRKKKIKTLSVWIIVVLVIIFVIYLLVKLSANAIILPPTTMNGHIEESPSSHILSEHMPEPIQKHMLEHADGKDMPGIIIHYNCSKFSCEADLVNKLENIVSDYPEHVYLAPGDRYDGKIILTRLNKQVVLIEFDQDAIKEFIEEK